MSVTKIMTVEEMQDRRKWLEMRRTGIGGSDAAVVVGLNAYQTLFSLWMDKTGQTDIEDEEGAELPDWIEAGIRSEKMIAEWFEDKTGKKLQRCGMLRSNEHPFMIADVDRLVVGENAIVEIKTTASWNKDEWAEDSIPDTYWAQIQHYMSVGGWEKCYVVCLVGGRELVIREVERNDEDIEALVEAERNFWENYVIPKKLPDVDGTETCKQALQKMYKGGDDDAIELDGSIDAEIDNYFALKEQIKKLEAMALERENKVRMLMEDHEFGRSPKYNISYKSGYARTGFNSKQFAKDHEKLYEQYKTVTTSRRLYIRESVARRKEREKLNG